MGYGSLNASTHLTIEPGDPREDRAVIGAMNSAFHFSLFHVIYSSFLSSLLSFFLYHTLVICVCIHLQT